MLDWLTGAAVLAVFGFGWLCGLRDARAKLDARERRIAWLERDFGVRLDEAIERQRQSFERAKTEGEALRVRVERELGFGPDERRRAK